MLPLIFLEGRKNKKKLEIKKLKSRSPGVSEFFSENLRS